MINSQHDPDEQTVSVFGPGDYTYLQANYGTAPEVAAELESHGHFGLAGHIRNTHDRHERIGYISGFEVDEFYRSQGHGSAIMNRALSHLDNDAKVDHTYLHFAPDRSAPGEHATRIYAKNGFKKIGNPDIFPVYHRLTRQHESRADWLINYVLGEQKQPSGYGYHVLSDHNHIESVKRSGLFGQQKNEDEPYGELHFTRSERHAQEYEQEQTLTLRFPVSVAGQEGVHIWPCDNHWTTIKNIHPRHIEYRAPDGSWKRI